MRRYTFHVGDLTVNEAPMFEVTRSVPENSNAGTNVGAPICAEDIDDDTLCFNLHGDGAEENFTIHGATGTETCGSLTAANRSGDNPICAQIQVKEGASLDYETTASYDLTLQVSDRKDHESNSDGQHTCIDNSIAVAIDVTDEAELTAKIVYPSRDTDVGNSGFDLVIEWNGPANATLTWHQRSVPPTPGLPQTYPANTVALEPQQNGTWEYWLEASYTEDG